MRSRVNFKSFIPVLCLIFNANLAFTIIVEPQCFANITTTDAHDPDKWVITSYKASEVENFDTSVNQTCTVTKKTGQHTYWLNGEKLENVEADYFNFQHSDCGELEVQNEGTGEGTDSFYQVWISQVEGSVISGEWSVRCVVQDEEYSSGQYTVNTTRYNIGFITILTISDFYKNLRTKRV